MTNNNHNPPGARNIVIVGGGTAGWMTAAALAKLYGDGLDVTLVESEAIGTVGVGEATLPHLRHFNERLGIDEAEFMRATSATIKLGIQFCDWGRIGDAYLHPFSRYGADLNGVQFHHYWRRLYGAGLSQRIGEFSLPELMAEHNRFAPPADDLEAVESTFRYAFQLDATAYAGFLRAFAEERGVQRVEGKVVDVRIDAESGFINSVTLEDDHDVAGDFFVDCSGFRALLIGQTLGAAFQDWSHWLPCDRAIAVACEGAGAREPYTRATARAAGWQWRIPLQHRVGNGHVYCSEFMSDEEALDTLLSSLEGEPLSSPNHLRFKAGQREAHWRGNCIAIGLSSGFLEPLESTSIYLIQAGLTLFAELFPGDGNWAAQQREFNRVMALEFERIRDFLVLHYVATERRDSPFWRHTQTIDCPDSLTHRIELFRERGVLAEYKDGLFQLPSWLAVLLGQNVMPRHYDPLADRIGEERLGALAAGTRRELNEKVRRMPLHSDFIASLREAG